MVEQSAPPNGFGTVKVKHDETFETYTSSHVFMHYYSLILEVELGGGGVRLIFNC